MAYRVQEYIKRSGRYHTSQRSFDDVRSALIELKVRAKKAMQPYGTYDEVNDRIISMATLTTNDHDEVHVTSEYGAVRIFTIVETRKGTAVPFGHLLKKATS